MDELPPRSARLYVLDRLCDVDDDGRGAFWSAMESQIIGEEKRQKRYLILERLAQNFEEQDKVSLVFAAVSIRCSTFSFLPCPLFLLSNLRIKMRECLVYYWKSSFISPMMRLTQGKDGTRNALPSPLVHMSSITPVLLCLPVHCGSLWCRSTQPVLAVPT